MIPKEHPKYKAVRNEICSILRPYFNKEKYARNVYNNPDGPADQIMALDVVCVVDFVVEDEDGTEDNKCAGD